LKSDTIKLYYNSRLQPLSNYPRLNLTDNIHYLSKATLSERY